MCLEFPASAYALEHVHVTGKGGQTDVRCRVWRFVPYTARPVDAEYQSLDLYEPVEIDGKAVDCSDAPIFFSIRVMGYTGVRNNAAGMLPPVSPPPPPPPNGRAEAPCIGPELSPTDMLALAAGLVVAIPGCRGRDCVRPDGTYYGKAPAAIVDLKAAVRYLRRNAAAIPGDPSHVISYGLSAGGALSALLGASGDSPEYEPYLRALGAAEASDRIFAAACFCPIMDLEHQDMAHEWMRGRQPYADGTFADQTLSRQLVQANAMYQDALALMGRGAFGRITADNYGRYITEEFLIPSATEFLTALPAAARMHYLSERPWLKWDGGRALFTFEQFCAYSGRMKGLPACDSFDLSTAENGLFGDETHAAAHFTDFSLRHTSGNPGAVLAPALAERVRLMNPMTFLRAGNPGAVRHWWLRCGALERGASLSILTNLATLAENAGMNVNYRYYWDRGHAVDDDPDQLFSWIRTICQSERAALKK